MCDWSLSDRWDQISGTFEKMALLEIHDTIDITDFSQISSVYRLKKAERKQEWAKIESDFISSGPRPEKEGLAVPSGVKVASNSADPEELRVSEAHDYESCNARHAPSGSQQSSSSSFGCGHPLSVQQGIADNESDFSSKNQDFHSNNDARTPRDVELEDKQMNVWDYQWFLENSKKVEDEEQMVARDHGGFDSSVSDWVMRLGKAEEVEEEQVVAQDDGGFGHGSINEDAASENTMVMEGEVKQVRTRDDGGFSADIDVRMTQIETELKEMREMKGDKAAKLAKKGDKANESYKSKAAVEKAAKKAAKKVAKKVARQARQVRQAKQVKGAEEVETQDDGGLVRDLDAVTAGLKEVKEMPGFGYGGFARSGRKYAGSEEGESGEGDAIVDLW